MGGQRYGGESVSRIHGNHPNQIVQFDAGEMTGGGIAYVILLLAVELSSHRQEKA